MTRPSGADRIARQHSRGQVIATAVVAALVVIAAVLVPSAAANATAYRFWSYWTGGAGSWSFSSIGASRLPPDGSVDGWRFAVSPATSSTTPPRSTPSFRRLCGGVDADAGAKRVGLVIDFGTSADAAPGEAPPRQQVATCAVVPDAATGYDVLASVVQIRVEDGLVCGLGGYPQRGCGEPVDDPAAPPTPSTPAPTSSAASNQSSTGPDGAASPSSAATYETSPSARGGGHRSSATRRDNQPSRTPIPTRSPAAAFLAAGVDPPPAPSPGGSLSGAAAVVSTAAVVAALVAAAVLVARRRRPGR